MTYGFLTFIDRSAEKSVASFNLTEIAGDGSNYAAVTASMAAVKAAFAAVTDGAIAEESLVASRTRLTNVIPGSGHRELKWLVRYQDDVTMKLYNLEIPNADDTALPMNAGSDFVDIGNAGAASFIAAFNTNILSPAGNAVTLISVQLVGRNI